MSSDNKKQNINEDVSNQTEGSNETIDVQKEKTLDVKLKESEDKLLRSLAEIENQRRRFEKELKDAFEFGSFNFARETLAILDNLQRAKIAIRNDDKLKNNKDLDKFLEEYCQFQPFHPLFLTLLDVNLGQIFYFLYQFS